MSKDKEQKIVSLIKDKKTRTVDAEKIKQVITGLLQDVTLADMALHDGDTTTTLVYAKFCRKYDIKYLDDLSDEQVPDALLYLTETLRRKQHKRDIKK